MIRRILLVGAIVSLFVAVIGLQWSSTPEDASTSQSRKPAAAAEAKPEPSVPDSGTTPSSETEADPDAVYVQWGGKLLRMEESKPDSDGHFQRTQWVQTKLKYPLLRIEEQLVLHAPGQHSELLSRKIVAADHILIKLQPGQDDEAIQLLMEQVRTEIPVELKEVRPFSGKLMVSFDSSRPKAMERALEAFRKRSDLVASAQVDAVLALSN